MLQRHSALATERARRSGRSSPEPYPPTRTSILALRRPKGAGQLAQRTLKKHSGQLNRQKVDIFDRDSGDT
jgi:hypothetical protein